MARQNKSITGFDQVAGGKQEKQPEPITPQPLADALKENSRDIVDTLLERSAAPAPKKWKVTGFYLDDDIERVLVRLAGKGVRGTKNAIVNEALRKYFKEKGLL